MSVDNDDNDLRKPAGDLRYGWTTGACATAACKAAFTALVTGSFPNPVEITLPKGQTPSFALAATGSAGDWAQAEVVKDAGDDPDVTHGALIRVRVSRGARGAGVIFRAGEGVGTVTKPGLPIPPGEPAINPVPRQMMKDVVEDISRQHDVPPDVIIEISVPGGAKIAKRTWNPRLGITGGISILGTTGIVVPYSCSAWIHSIHSGINVARATGRRHIGAAVGSTSEKLLKSLYGMPDEAIIDMGDFVGGMVKYLKKHPVKQVSIAGGFGKFSKLANGALDLHSSRAQVDKGWLAELLSEMGAPARLVTRAAAANTALEILQLAQTDDFPLADRIAELALHTVRDRLQRADMEIEILISDRDGNLVARIPRSGLL